MIRQANRITRSHVASRAKGLGYELREQRSGDAYGLRDQEARKNFRWVLAAPPHAPSVGAHTLSDLLNFIEVQEIAHDRY